MSKEEKVIFQSINEFNGKYFPNSEVKEEFEASKDTQAIGIKMAQDSMKKILGEKPK